jgi:hypothetical protein
MSATKGKTALALTRVWHHASAQDRVLGNLASRIAWVLMGKHKPTYDPAGESRPSRYLFSLSLWQIAARPRGARRDDMI